MLSCCAKKVFKPPLEEVVKKHLTDKGLKPDINFMKEQDFHKLRQKANFEIIPKHTAKEIGMKKKEKEKSEMAKLPIEFRVLGDFNAATLKKLRNLLSVKKDPQLVGVEFTQQHNEDLVDVFRASACSGWDFVCHSRETGEELLRNAKKHKQSIRFASSDLKHVLRLCQKILNFPGTLALQYLGAGEAHSLSGWKSNISKILGSTGDEEIEHTLVTLTMFPMCYNRWVCTVGAAAGLKMRDIITHESDVMLAFSTSKKIAGVDPSVVGDRDMFVPALKFFYDNVIVPFAQYAIDSDAVFLEGDRISLSSMAFTIWPVPGDGYSSFGFYRLEFVAHMHQPEVLQFTPFDDLAALARRAKAKLTPSSVAVCHRGGECVCDCGGGHGHGSLASASGSDSDEEDDDAYSTDSDGSDDDATDLMLLMAMMMMMRPPEDGSTGNAGGTPKSSTGSGVESSAAPLGGGDDGGGATNSGSNISNPFSGFGADVAARSSATSASNMARRRKVRPRRKKK